MHSGSCLAPMAFGKNIRRKEPRVLLSFLRRDERYREIFA